MIEYDKLILPNGLRVLFHKDKTSPIAAFNILYDVGARDEHKDRTGFAHLFEHLMFGGSKNIPDFDKALQLAGGDNNAYTSNDVTNYYSTLPATNIESAFWLDSDRLNELAFSNKSLEVQRNVVVEEFKQTCLNQPYGDVWQLLRPICYEVHSYSWSTIGKKIEHIEDANMQEVKSFFYKHYTPSNAILSIAGNLEYDRIVDLSEKWFGGIENRKTYVRDIPQESIQKNKRELWVERKVPNDAIYMAFKMDARNDVDYHTTDLISDLLSSGKSSILYKNLVKDNPRFIEISAYIMGSFDKGLFIISALPIPGISLKDAYKIIRHELDNFITNKVSDRDLNKVKNKMISSMVFQDMSVLNKAMNLALYELLGDANNINTEINRYTCITKADIQRVSKKIFLESRCSVLYYKAI
jgi:predicted Zn-dependent peptidase